jgi:hypothetical protein
MVLYVVSGEIERIWKETFVASSGYSPGICVEELREAKKKNLPALLCPG